jgi:hypothetical protein
VPGHGRWLLQLVSDVRRSCVRVDGSGASWNLGMIGLCLSFQRPIRPLTIFCLSMARRITHWPGALILNLLSKRFVENSAPSDLSLKLSTQPAQRTKSLINCLQASADPQTQSQASSLEFCLITARTSPERIWCAFDRREDTTALSGVEVQPWVSGAQHHSTPHIHTFEHQKWVRLALRP